MTRSTLRTRAARVATGALALGFAALVVGVPALAAEDHRTPAPVQAKIVQKDEGDGPTKVYTATKELTRTFAEADGSSYSFPTNTVTVNATPTTDLRSRQRVHITWSGAQPSGGRAPNPYGENGTLQEYPVVVLQCRGTDNPSLPPDQQVRPETCWTNSVAERSQVATNASESAWLKDLQATPEEKQPVTVGGGVPAPDATTCPTVTNDGGSYTHLTPFISDAGQTYYACDSKTMPPEAGVGTALPAAEIAAFTDADGNGSVEFEVRTKTENESLGCDSDTPCTLEVIPINGLSCAPQDDPPTLQDTACRKGGQFEPGSSNFAGKGVDQSVSWPLWWSATNWANRIPVPLTFGLPPDVCDVLDKRPPTGFYGSELMSQASLQWSPAYCLNKRRFKYQHNVMPDAAGFTLMDSGGGPAAFVSSAHKAVNDDPVGYAPTAVTGFGIGYVMDLADNRGEYTDLKLTPRLVAKLLTQSYPGSDLGQGHPGIETNPITMATDPDFIRLNPDVPQINQEPAATLMTLSVSSDVLEQLTDWIAHDKDAMAFIDGQADPWGMKVNPAYKKINLPRPEWPLKDTYIPTTENKCRQANPAVYFNQLAAPVSSMRAIAQALLDAWPLAQTRCDADLATGGWKLGRIDRQNYGNRFMLGLVSLGDAQRYGLRTAELQTTSGTFVGADQDSLGAAVGLMHVASPDKGGKGGGKGGKSGGKGGKSDGQGGKSGDRLVAERGHGSSAGGGRDDAKGQPFVLDQQDVRKAGDAYPGTMVVYTAAKERNLEKADAEKVAEFIRISTSEGQRLGTGNGELPLGFVPLEKTGGTKKLWESAQYVADKVEAQTPAPAEPTDEPTEGPTGGPDPTLPPGPDVTLPTDVPDAGEPSEAPTAAAPTSAPPTETGPVEMPETQAVSSSYGNRTIPILLLVGLIGVAVTSGVRFFVRPPTGGPRA